MSQKIPQELRLKVELVTAMLSPVELYALTPTLLIMLEPELERIWEIIKSHTTSPESVDINHETHLMICEMVAMSKRRHAALMERDRERQEK